MDRLKWRAEKEKREKAALDRHARLHELFVNDRLAFERERKRTIDEFLDSIEDDKMRDKLQASQHSWDKKMRHAGSEHNRFVLAQTFFWSHFYETWNPAIQQLNLVLNGNRRGSQIRVDENPA